VGAIYHYEIYLKKSGNAPDAPVVREYMQMARAKLLKKLKEEKLPGLRSSGSDREKKLIAALRSENSRMAKTLAELNQKYLLLKAQSAAGKSVPDSNQPRTSQEELYTIRSGDTLSGIAASHGVPLRSLMSANGLTGSSILRTGQVIRIPR
jgi:LysM repeat protein